MKRIEDQAIRDFLAVNSTEIEGTSDRLSIFSDTQIKEKLRLKCSVASVAGLRRFLRYRSQRDKTDRMRTRLISYRAMLTELSELKERVKVLENANGCGGVL